MEHEKHFFLAFKKETRTNNVSGAGEISSIFTYRQKQKNFMKS